MLYYKKLFRSELINTNFTKKAIIEAFWKLLEEKPYNKITVKEIVDSCQINRNTFYYHFHDIPDLLEQIIRLYKCVLVGIFLDWLNEGMNYDLLASFSCICELLAGSTVSGDYKSVECTSVPATIFLNFSGFSSIGHGRSMFSLNGCPS